MLDSQEWKDWYTGGTRFLWIHGIPGAGKTVLASFLIQQLPTQPISSLSIASAYYYCYFGHDQDETEPLLRWTVSQLCRQTRRVPPSILSVFERGHSPSVSGLLDGLADMVLLFERVNIIVDAVDESKEPRTALLSVLETLAMAKRFENVRLLVTSRQYFDIKSVFSTCSVPACIQADKIEMDIRIHVHATLRTHQRFAKWPADLRDQMEDVLAVRARGM